MTTFFFPQGGHCGEVQPYLKIPWRSKIIMYIYMKLCSIFNCFFSFSGWREEQTFVLNRVGADLQVFISGSNNRGVADITEIMATGKRSQVVIIGWLWTFIGNTLFGYLQNFRKRFSSGNVCWCRLGSGYEISWRGITCSLWKQPFLLAPCRFWHFARRNLWDSATEIPYWWCKPVFTYSTAQK